MAQLHTPLLHTPLETLTHTCIDTHTQTHTHTHSQTHTPPHTHTHTYIHTHTHHLTTNQLNVNQELSCVLCLYIYVFLFWYSESDPTHLKVLKLTNRCSLPGTISCTLIKLEWFWKPQREVLPGRHISAQRVKVDEMWCRETGILCTRRKILPIVQFPPPCFLALTCSLKDTVSISVSTNDV